MHERTVYYSLFEIYRWLENSRRGCWLIATLTFAAICIDLFHIRIICTLRKIRRYVRDVVDATDLYSIFLTCSHFSLIKIDYRQVNSRIETHSTGSQTRFYLYFDVFAPDFCVEVNSFTRRWINVQRTEERGWGGSFAYWPLFISIESIRNCSSWEFDREDSLLIAIGLALWLEISRWWIEKSDKQNYRY